MLLKSIELTRDYTNTLTNYLSWFSSFGSDCSQDSSRGRKVTSLSEGITCGDSHHECLGRPQAFIRHVRRRFFPLSDRITSCQVVVETPHQHHRQGNIYHMRINLTLPGKELVIDRSSSQNHSHEDLYVVIGDAFAAAQRQLKRYATVQKS